MRRDSKLEGGYRNKASLLNSINQDLDEDDIDHEEESEESVEERRKSIYLENISSICSATEKLFKLNTVNSAGVIITSLPIEDFVIELNSLIKVKNQGEILVSNTRVSGKISILNYLSSRLNFYNRLILSFEGFRNLELIVDVLTDFINQSTVTNASKQCINGIIETLSYFEKDNFGYAKNEVYRLFRLFIINITFSNYVDASIISELLLKQLCLYSKNVDRGDKNDR